MTTLKAEKRSMDVKAKRLRREGYVTGCAVHRLEDSRFQKHLRLRNYRSLRTRIDCPKKSFLWM